MNRPLATSIALLCLLPGGALAQRLPAVVPPAQAQQLPPVLEQLPRGLPQVVEERLPVDASPLRDAVAALPRVASAAVRRQTRTLLQRHPRELERDPRGAPIMRAVVIALSPDAAALQRAQARGYVIQEDRALPELQQRMVTLLVPAGTGTAEALRELRAADPAGQYDFDHLYVESAAAPASAMASSRPMLQPDAPLPVRVGLIDGGVDAAHPVFARRPPQVSGCGGRPQPSVHGTAVASLFVGWSEGFMGAAPGAELHAVDVYCGQQGPGGRMRDVAAGLADLAAAQVRIINLSIVGPDNAVLAAVVRAVQARQVLLVAAAGNDGPNAPPLYPAAYPGVIAVTGVDARARVLAEAGSGEHISFAAPGADMLAAAPGGQFAVVRGTSFAAPLVAGMLAREIAARSGVDREQLVRQLAAGAEDRGAKGRDRRYGLGLVGAGLRVDPVTYMGRQAQQHRGSSAR